MVRLPEIHYPHLLRAGVVLSGPRWQLRRAIRVMNQVLSSLGLEQHPDKTFIGRTQRGFFFILQFIAFGGKHIPVA